MWVIGKDEKAHLAKISRNYEKLNFSDHQRLKRFIDKKNFDYLIPGCSDASYLACVSINENRYANLDSIDIFNIIHNKANFRKFASSIDIPVPRSVAENEIHEFSKVIIKPIDSFSGKGISVLSKPCNEKLSRAKNHAESHSLSGEIIVEEYIEGQLFSHSAFFQNQELVADFIVRENCTASPFSVDLSYVESGFDKNILTSYRKDISRLMRSLNLEKGLIHTQFVLRGDKFYVIEAARRCPGDLYSLLIELTTHHNYTENYVAPFIDKNIRVKNKSLPPNKNFIIRHTLIPQENILLNSIAFNQSVHIKQFFPLVSVGDFLPSGTQGRAGIIFFECQNMQENQKIYQNLLSRKLYSFN